MKPPGIVMDSPRTRDLKEIRRKRLEYFSRNLQDSPENSPKISPNVASTNRASIKLKLPSDEELDKDLIDLSTPRTYVVGPEPEKNGLRKPILSQSHPNPTLHNSNSSKAFESVPKLELLDDQPMFIKERQVRISRDVETISQPGGEYETEILDNETEIEFGKRSFTNVSNVSKLWDSIMLKHLGESVDTNDDGISDSKSKVSEVTDFTLAASTNVSNKFSLASTAYSTNASISRDSDSVADESEVGKKSKASKTGLPLSKAAPPLGTVVPDIKAPDVHVPESISAPKVPPLFETSIEQARENSSSVREILTSPQNDITLAMVKLGITNNSYVEGYLKGLRHALGRDAFLQVVETSPDLREIIDSMIHSQRSSVQQGPVSKSFSGPFHNEEDEARKSYRPNEYRDIDTRYVSPYDSKPGPSGDAKYQMSPNRDEISKKRNVSSRCATFSADEIYRQAKDITLRESVAKDVKKTIHEEVEALKTSAMNQVQYGEESPESEILEESEEMRKDEHSSITKSGISRDAQLWRDSDKKQPHQPKPTVNPTLTESINSHATETPSLRRYFSSLERLNLSTKTGQSVNYTEVSAQFEPLREWATPRDETEVGTTVSRDFSKSVPKAASEIPMTQEESTKPQSLPESMKSQSGAVDSKRPGKFSPTVPKPEKSTKAPNVHASLPPNVTDLLSSSQDDLEGNFKAFRSYENYLGQLRQSWKESCIFKNDRSIDDFLEKIASKSNNMNDFIHELRNSFDVRKSRDYDVTSGSPADWLRKSLESYGTESGTHITGLTDKLNKIGVDWTLIREDIMADDSEKVGGASFRGPDGRSFVVTCPECGTNNRPYVTWCLDCGCVLIGVEPTETKKSAKGKSTKGGAPSNQKPTIPVHVPTIASKPVPKSNDLEGAMEFSQAKPQQSAPPVSGKSPRLRNKPAHNPELAIHLSMSSSMDNNTRTSVETPEIEVLPRLSTAGLKSSPAPVPSLDLTETSEERQGVQSPDTISVASREFDSDEETPRNELFSNNESLQGFLAGLHPLPSDESREIPEVAQQPLLSNKGDERNLPDILPLPSNRVVTADASTSPDLHPDALNKPKVTSSFMVMNSPSMTSQRPSTAGSSSRLPSNSEKRPQSAGSRNKRVAKSVTVDRVRSAEKPRWQTSSMEWYAKNKQRTNAWQSGKPMFTDVRKSRTLAQETSQTAVEPFVPSPSATPRHDVTTSADVQNYTGNTWQPGKALYQNKEGRFGSRRPFQWTINKDRFAQLVSQSPRILTGDVSFLLCLPEELSLHVLSQLGHRDLASLGKTCRHMNRLAMDDSLWRCIRVHGRRLTDQHLEEMGLRRPAELDLTNCLGDQHVTTSGVRALFRHGESLQSLKIAGCTGGALTADSLLHAATSRCPALTHVNVATTNVSDSVVTSFSQTCERLVALNVSGNQNIADETVMTVCQKHGKSLESLEIADCFNISSKSVKSIGQHCKNLLKLNMGQCYKITDQSVSQLAPALTRLVHLDLRGCKQVKDSAIRDLVRHCKRLESLTLANCQGCTDLAVVEIATYVHNIKYLDMSGCRLVTDVGIRSLAHNCLLLRYLDLSNTGVSHKSVSMLASYCSQRLEIIKLNFCRDVTELSLVKLARHCRNLREMHLYGCKPGAKNASRIVLENPGLEVKQM